MPVCQSEDDFTMCCLTTVYAEICCFQGIFFPCLYLVFIVKMQIRGKILKQCRRVKSSSPLPHLQSLVLQELFCVYSRYVIPFVIWVMLTERPAIWAKETDSTHCTRGAKSRKLAALPSGEAGWPGIRAVRGYQD